MGNQIGIPYKLTGPDGTLAVFNDPALPPELVGYITRITGLESPPIRFSTEDVPEGDGADVDPAYYGGRPFPFARAKHVDPGHEP